jgi:hypothetical protein
MRTNISKQLGLPIAPPEPKAPSLEAQLGFVAEYDKSLNTNSRNDFFNASGNDGNWRNDRKYYTGRASTAASVDYELDNLRIRNKDTGKIITKDLNYVKSKIEQYTLKAENLKNLLEGDNLNVTTAQYTTNSQKNKDRALANGNRGFYEDVVKRLKEILNDMETAQAKIKADAEAKVKADAEAAEAKLKAAEEAAKQAKIAALKKQIAESTDPNVKKQLTDQLSGLLEEGAAGLKSNKFLLIGGAVAVIGILYYFFRSKE